jgi:hypothetical protein
MKVLMELDITDDRIGRVISVKDAACKIAHLQLGGGILELFEYTNSKGSNNAKKTTSMIRVN